jgi:hypothetical protein
MAGTEKGRGCTETGLEGTYMDMDRGSITEGAECLYCHLKIPKQRRGKLFCNPRCRNAFHNKRKLKGHLDAFTSELNDLLIRYGISTVKRAQDE